MFLAFAKAERSYHGFPARHAAREPEQALSGKTIWRTRPAVDGSWSSHYAIGVGLAPTALSDADLATIAREVSALAEQPVGR